MRVHLLQFDIAWEDRAANFARVDRLLAHAPVNPGDLLVLPEMFDAGFSLNVEKTCDAAGETLNFLQTLARRLRCTVHGSRTLLAADGMGRNCATIIAPDGELLREYAKIHPFTYGREGERFAPGVEVTTYAWRGDARAGGSPAPLEKGDEAGHGAHTLTVCPVVCYDLRFPELFRLGLDLGAEAFALGANWPRGRAAHWRALNIARAIENQAFVFAVNRVGADPHLEYSGGSLVVGPRGEILAEAGESETVLSVGVDPAWVREWRAEFPAWRDRRLALPAPRRDTPEAREQGVQGAKTPAGGPETSRRAAKSSHSRGIGG